MKFVVKFFSLLYGVNAFVQIVSSTAPLKKIRTPRFAEGDYDGFSQRSGQFPDISHVVKYDYSGGCFSRKNLELMTRQNDSKFTVYPNRAVCQINCLKHCSEYFRGFPDKHGMVAVQFRLCICFFLPEDASPFYQVNETECNLKYYDGFVAGGQFALSFYCRSDSNSCPPETQRTIYSDTKIDDFNSDLDVCQFDLNEIDNLMNGTEMTLDFNGNPCNRNVPTSVNNHAALLPFLNAYIPEARNNPSLCIKYCKYQHIYGAYYKMDEQQASYKYSIVISALPPNPRAGATVSDKRMFPIDQCHCTNNLYTFEPLKIQQRASCDEISIASQQQHRNDNPSFNKGKISAGGCNPMKLPAAVYFQTQQNLKNCNSTKAKKCQAKDGFGVQWTACPTEIEKKNCSVFGGFSGSSYWECSADGEFVDEQPTLLCWSDKLRDISNHRPVTTDVGMEAKWKLHQLKILVPPSDGVTKYLGREILKVNDLVREQVDRIRNISVSLKDRENITTEAVTIVGNLISSMNPWRQLKSVRQKARYHATTTLLSSVEDYLFSFVEGGTDEIFGNSKTSGFYEKTMHPIGNTTKNSNQNFSVTVGALKNYNIKVKYPPDSQTTYISVSKKLNVSEEQVAYVGMLISPEISQNLMPSTVNKLGKGYNTSSNLNFNGQIISLTFQNKTFGKIVSGGGIKVNFVHQVPAVGSKKTYFARKLHPGEQRKAILGETRCVYWNTTTLEWRGDGCEMLDNRLNAHETICKCNHLTAFAILTDFHEYAGKNKGLEILTLILCPLSIFLLMVTLIVLTKMKVVQGERTTITKHLCANLIVSNIFLLLFVDRNYFWLSQTNCTNVGILTHYTFLVSFGWIAVQGIHLFRMVVLIFDARKDYMPTYAIVVYTYPLVPIGLTATVGYTLGDQPYGGVMFCWLNGNYIWAFLAPVALILCGNFVVMFITLAIVHKQKNLEIRKHNEATSKRKWLKGVFSITVVLGLTWVAGFFTLLDEPAFPFMSYVFTLFNASQGIFIFVLFCAMHEKVQSLILEKLHRFGRIFSRNKGSVSGTPLSVYHKQAENILNSHSQQLTINSLSFEAQSISETEEAVISHSTSAKHQLDNEHRKTDGDNMDSRIRFMANESTKPVENKETSISNNLSNRIVVNELIMERRILGPPWLEELRESELYIQKSVKSQSMSGSTKIKNGTTLGMRISGRSQGTLMRAE